MIVGVNSNTVSTTQPIGAHVNVAGFGTALATGSVQFTVDGNAMARKRSTPGGRAFQHFCASIHADHRPGRGFAHYRRDIQCQRRPKLHEREHRGPEQRIDANGKYHSDRRDGTTTSLTPQTLPVNLGDTGKFTVTVSPAGATGTVTLWDVVGPRTSATPIANGTRRFSYPGRKVETSRFTPSIPGTTPTRLLRARRFPSR